MNINKLVSAKLDFHQDEKIKQESDLFLTRVFTGIDLRLGLGCHYCLLVRDTGHFKTAFQNTCLLKHLKF